MPRLKNRNKCPINGFQYFQPETGADFKEWSFDTLVTKLQSHRQANPRFNLPTDLASVQNEVDNVNALRMLAIPSGSEYVAQASTEPPKATPLLGQRLERVAAGGASLIEWIANKAEAVPQEQAINRATVCVACPMNDTKGDLLSYFTRPVSEAIRHAISSLGEMTLETPLDDKLGICTACDCPTKLKVHIPLERIVGKMTKDTQAGLHANCWILKEQQK